MLLFRTAAVDLGLPFTLHPDCPCEDRCEVQWAQSKT